MSDAPDRAWSELALGASRFRWVETAALTAFMPLIGLWLRPEDPLFLEAELMWLLLGPLLSGLRYGFAHGFSSALGLLLAITWYWRSTESGTPYPVSEVAGLMLIGMLAGEFTDLWLRRLTKLETINDYRRQRLDEFTRAYHLLKISHDRLEHRLVGAAQSLRGALLDLKKALLENARARRGLAELGPMVMGIFTSHGFVQVAALYRLDERRRLLPQPIAVLGNAPALSPADPMLARAIAGRCLVSVREVAEVGQPGDPLAIVPLEDVGGRMWAVLAVHEMPFIAFQSEHLHLLAVLGGHLADMFTQAQSADAGFDAAGADFKLRLSRAFEDQKKHHMPAMVVAVSFGPRAEEAGLPAVVAEQRRGLDQEWHTRRADGRPLLFVVMPLTDEQGLKGYRARLERMLSERFPELIDEVQVEVRPIDGVTPVDQLLRELGAKEVADGAPA